MLTTTSRELKTFKAFAPCAVVPRRPPRERGKGLRPGSGRNNELQLDPNACSLTPRTRGRDTRALQAYLGHKNIHHTVRYTELAPTRFRDFWR